MDPHPPLAPPPQTQLHVARPISFRHPAYSPTERDLLRFPPINGPKRDGVDYNLALISCGIVTGNTWPDGWLARKGDDGNFSLAERPEDGILREEEYYYFAGKQEPAYKYPVIPLFHHWRFPHRILPDLWSRLVIDSGPEINARRKDEAVLARDNTCRITGYKAAREVAHLVPQADGHWFNSNQMRSYCAEQFDQQPIDDTRNNLVLRRDLHYLFDQRRFVFTVKRDKSDQPRLVIHVLDHQRTDELIDLYHNRLLQPLSGISVELIFARLAWAIFNSQAFPLFDGMAKWTVRLFDPETSETKDCHLYQQEIRDKKRLFGIYPRSRSASPLKRNLNQAVEDEVGFDTKDWPSDQDALEDDASTSSFGEWPNRGRRRKRSWDEHSHHTPPGLVGSSVSSRHCSSSTSSSDAANEARQDEVATPVSAIQQADDAYLKADEAARPHKRANLGG